jgi:hypothetical protein
MKLIKSVKMICGKDIKKMTNEWLQGYLAALKNIELLTVNFSKDTDDGDAIDAYANVLHTIEEVRTNYKKLVEELNEKSKK